MVPTERLKVVMQAPATRARGFANPIQAVGSLYRSGGVASLYRGASANFLRLAIGYVVVQGRNARRARYAHTSVCLAHPRSQVYFPVFEGVSQALASPGQRPGPAAVVLAGGLAGALLWPRVGCKQAVVLTTLRRHRHGALDDWVSV